MDITLSNIDASAKVDLEKWAQITIEKWQWNLVSKNLVYSGDLLRSFTSQVYADAAGDSMMISFAFNYYLKMLDMGVGKGVSFEETGRESGRKKYKVYSSTTYSQIMRLLELLQIQYMTMGANAIVNEFKHGSNAGAIYKI